MVRTAAEEPRPNGRRERDVALLVPKERPASEQVWPDAPAKHLEAGRQASDRRAGAAADDLDNFGGLQAVDPSLHVSDRVSGFRNDPFVGLRPPVGGRMLRAVIRFCVVFLLGVGATLAWQAEGDEAVDMAKTAALTWAPNWVSLAWLASPGSRTSTSSVSMTKPAAVAQATGQAAAPQPVQPAAPAAAAMPSDAVQQMQTMARDVAFVRHSVEQLAARQEEMAQNIATLQAAEQDIWQKIAALPRAAPVPRRKPPQTAAPSAGTQSSSTQSPAASSPPAAVQSPSELVATPAPRPPAPLH